MAMREICCSDEGDQGLNEGDSSKLQKDLYFNDLLKSLTPFILVDCSIHIDTLSME